MNKFFKNSTIAVIVGISLLASSCAKDLNSTTVVDSATAGIALEGTVVSARQVTVKGSDKLGNGMGVGTLGGAALGGVGGNSLGKGTGNAAATVGGVLLGGLIGTLAEDKLSQSQGMEYVVKVSDDNADTSSSDDSLTVSRGSKIQDKVVNSTKFKAKTKLITVVQGLDQIFSVGQKVYVIYNDNRPRLAPAY